MQYFSLLHQTSLTITEITSLPIHQVSLTIHQISLTITSNLPPYLLSLLQGIVAHLCSSPTLVLTLPSYPGTAWYCYTDHPVNTAKYRKIRLHSADFKSNYVMCYFLDDYMFRVDNKINHHQKKSIFVMDQSVFQFVTYLHRHRSYCHIQAQARPPYAKRLLRKCTYATATVTPLVCC
jgi:hypothetical protein